MCERCTNVGLLKWFCAPRGIVRLQTRPINCLHQQVVWFDSKVRTFPGKTASNFLIFASYTVFGSTYVAACCEWQQNAIDGLTSPKSNRSTKDHYKKMLGHVWFAYHLCIIYCTSDQNYESRKGRPLSRRNRLGKRCIPAQLWSDHASQTQVSTTASRCGLKPVGKHSAHT